MKPNIGISQKNLDASCEMLSVLLSDELILYTKTRKFHWNVSGSSFMELHELFEDQHTALVVIIDATAERINQLGAKTIGIMREFMDNATLSEKPNKYPNQNDMVLELCKDNEKIIQYLRESIAVCASNDDVGSADFLTGVMKTHEKNAWVLRRYLN